MIHVSSDVLFFKLPSCMACKKMVDYIDPEEVDVIDLADEDNHGLKYEFGVHSVPTTIVRRDGVEVRRRIGLMTPKAFRSFISREERG